MNVPSRRQRLADAASGMLASAPVSRALTLTIVGTAYFSYAIRSVIGWPGLIGMLVALVTLATWSIVAKRAELEWHGLLPISLIVFLVWSAFSILLTEYQWAALGAVVYQVSFAFLAVYIAVTRDLIQIVRAFGDILRLALAGSFVLEVLSGLLLDVPFRFLNIAGNLDQGGPIQGLVGSRNQLGLIALIALITFYVEFRTRSLPRPVAIASISMAGLAIILAASPVTFGALGVVALAAAALARLRRVDASARRMSQFVLLGATALALIILFLARSRVIAALNAGSAFELRYALWRDILRYIPDHALEGFGWLGYWQRGFAPYSIIDRFGAPHDSALNAFIDVWLQLGLVGMLFFIVLVGLALLRSWLLASNKRSVGYLWPALVLLALVITSAAESSILVEFGWLTLVVCAVKASRELSWRARLPSA